MAKLSDPIKAIGITNHPHLGGDNRIRFGRDFITSVKRNGQDATRCDYVELPEPSDKLAALKYLQAHPDFQSPDDQFVIIEKLAKYLPKKTRVSRSQGAKLAVDPAVKLAEIASREKIAE